eukprot:934810-Prymnesium_polylepis.1
MRMPTAVLLFVLPPTRAPLKRSRAHSVLATDHLRDTRKAKSLGYCEISMLSRADLLKTLESFPEAKKLVQEAALKLAFSRAMLIISLYSNAKKARRESFTNAMSNLSALGNQAMDPTRTSMTGPRTASILRANSEWKHVRQRKQRASDILQRVNDLLEVETPWREAELEQEAHAKAAALTKAAQEAAAADEEDTRERLRVGCIVEHA